MTGPLELLVFAYPDETSADESLKNLKRLKKEGLIDIVNAAVIVKDEKGRVHAKETADPGAKQGALFGAVVGGLIGLVGGPAGVVIGAAAGAGTGGVAAKKIDMGIPDDQIEELASSLEKGNSAIVAIIDHAWVDKVLEEVEDEAESVLRQAVKDEISEQLQGSPEEGGDSSTD